MPMHGVHRNRRPRRGRWRPRVLGDRLFAGRSQQGLDETPRTRKKYPVVASTSTSQVVRALLLATWTAGCKKEDSDD
eukprot:scaffold314765_cov27-Tisochrysis_lutea.AAC.1